MPALGASQPELSRTEAYLVDAAREGDDRAFGELYERYGGRIFAYVLGRVRDHNRAEDIAQDVFVSALRRMRSSDRAISFKPWIYEIAKNACIDEFRRVQRSREVSIEPDREGHLVSTNPSPHTCFEQRQQLNALHGAFRGLSERQHTVMVLRELEGLSYTEIAARTGMTLPMVESTLLRARRRLSQ
jgi:RNA polymerase sigma factor (sigma-70 family)